MQQWVRETHFHAAGSLQGVREEPATRGQTASHLYIIYLAVPGLRCGVWDLVPGPEMGTWPPALGACSVSH